MRRKLLVTVAAGLMSLALSIPVFAGEWKQDETGWWYQNEDGSYLSSGWTWVDGRCYYFTSEGYCLIDTQTPDGYTVDASGAWIVDGVVQTQNLGGPGDSGTVTAGASVQLDGLTFTVPDGFVLDPSAEAGTFLAYHTGQEAAVMGASMDMPEMAEYEGLIHILQGKVLDAMMIDVFGEPTSKGSLEFVSGTWYIYNYADASAVGAPVTGTMHAYIRFNGTRFQMVLFLGDFSGMDVNGIMNNNIR